MPFTRYRNSPLDSFSYDTAIKPSFTRWEGMKASYDLASMSTLRGLFYRTGVPDRESDEMLDASFLNDAYPGLEKPFTGPVSREFAEHIIERDMERKRLMALAQAAPQDKLQWVMNTGAGFGASLVDPFEAGLSVMAGGLLRVGVNAFRAGRTASLLAGSGQNLSRIQQAKRAAAYNLAGSTAVEPMLYVGANRMHEERTLGDAMVSIAASTIAGTALEMSFRVGGDVLRDISSGRFTTNMKSKMGLSQVGRDVNLDAPNPQIDMGSVVLRPRKDGEAFDLADSVVRGSELKRGSLKRTPQSVKAQGSFYTITTSPRGGSPIGRQAGFGAGISFFTNATNMSNSPQVALRALGMDGKKSFFGGLDQLDISRGNFVDADVPMSFQNQAVRSLMKELGVKKETGTLREALNDVKMKDQNRVQELVERQLTENEYQGFVFSEKVGDDIVENAVVFGENIPYSDRVFDIPNQPALRRDLTDQQISEALSDPNSLWFYDKQGQQMMGEMPTKPRPETEVGDLSFDERAFQSLEARKDAHPDVKEALRAHKQMKELASESDSIIKAAIFCGGS